MKSLLKEKKANRGNSVAVQCLGLRFHCRGREFNPWSASRVAQPEKERKKERKKETQRAWVEKNRTCSYSDRTPSTESAASYF